MADFRGKVALVTGAGSGIGRAIAIALADVGATLCLVGRQAGKLQKVTELVDKLSSRAVAYPTDLTVDNDIDALFTAIEKDTGTVDILIHSAGVHSMGGIDSASVESLDLLYRTNLRAPYLLTQKCLPMLKACSGQVVFINSSAGLNASAGLAQYSATKYALKGIADSLRAEVNQYGVRVMSVYPGRTAGPLQKTLHESEGKRYIPERLMQPEDVADIVVSALQLPFTAEVTDINIRPMAKPG